MVNVILNRYLASKAPVGVGGFGCVVLDEGFPKLTASCDLQSTAGAALL